MLKNTRFLLFPNSLLKSIEGNASQSCELFTVFFTLPFYIVQKITIFYFQVGAAFIFSLIGGMTTERYGRKPTILAASVIFSVGASKI